MITLPTSGPAAVKAGLLNQLRWGPYLPRECPQQLCLYHTRRVHAAHKGHTVGAPHFRGQGLHFWAPQNFSNIRPLLEGRRSLLLNTLLGTRSLLLNTQKQTHKVRQNEEREENVLNERTR